VPEFSRLRGSRKHRSRGSESESPSDERTCQGYVDAHRPPTVETSLRVRNRHAGRRREMRPVREADGSAHMKAARTTIRQSESEPHRRGEYGSREEPEGNGAPRHLSTIGTCCGQLSRDADGRRTADREGTGSVIRGGGAGPSSDEKTDKGRDRPTSRDTSYSVAAGRSIV
jgi:hypothetical protein